MSIYRSLVKIASFLDSANLFEEADAIDVVLHRLAQTSGPNNLNLPMESRMVPFDDEEFKDSDDERNLNPRYRSKPHFVDTEGNDTEQEHDTSIFGLNSPQDENGGVTQKVVDFYSAGMDNGGGGLDDYEWNHVRRDAPYHNLPAH